MHCTQPSLPRFEASRRLRALVYGDPTVTREPTEKKPFSSPSAVDFSSPGDTTEAEHLEKLLDEGLIETFPASDPVAIAIERDTRNPTGHTKKYQ